MTTERSPIFDGADPCGATFHVDVLGPQASVRYDSRGTTEGTRAYRRGMVLMLQRLAALGAVVHRVVIETSTTRHLSLEERTLRLPWSYPLQLRALVRDEADADKVRAAIHTAASQAGRAPGSKGGGNGTKRLRIYLDLDAVAVLTDAIAHGRVALVEVA